MHWEVGIPGKAGVRVVNTAVLKANNQDGLGAWHVYRQDGFPRGYVKHSIVEQTDML